MLRKWENSKNRTNVEIYRVVHYDIHVAVEIGYFKNKTPNYSNDKMNHDRPFLLVFPYCIFVREFYLRLFIFIRVSRKKWTS